MDRRSIFLKSISCRGVKSFNLFQKPSTYTIISIAAGNDGRLKRKQQKQKTSADHEGGENPEWDQTIRFDLEDTDFQDTFLEFAIMAQGNLVLFGHKLIGKSRVPMADLTSGHPSDVVRHVSYQIRSPEGKPNGILSFSYSLSLPEKVTRIPPPVAPGISSTLPIEVDIPPLTKPIDDCNPPPVPCRNSLYPPLRLPEAGPEECFCYCSQPPPVGPGIPSALPIEDDIPPLTTPIDDCNPPPVPRRNSLYPPLGLPEAGPEEGFCYCSQPPPQQPHEHTYYPPPPREPTRYPPPPPASSTGYYTAFERAVSVPPPASSTGYYTAFERAVSAPVLSRDAYFSPPLDVNGGYYPPPMPAFGTSYPSSAPGYIYPPPQDSCGYWNCK